MLDNKRINRSSNDNRALGLGILRQIYVNTTNAVILVVIRLWGSAIRFNIKALFAAVTIAVFSLVILSIYTESRCWQEIENVGLAVDASIYAQRYAVIERFPSTDDRPNDLGLRRGMNPNPFKDFNNRKREYRGRLFSTQSKLTYCAVVGDKINVKIEIVAEHGVLNFGPPRIVIYAEKTNANNWLVENIESMLETTFGLHTECGG